MREITFLDANAFVGKTAYDGTKLPHTADGLCDDMAQIRLDEALVFHKEALNDPVFGNQLLIEQIAGHPQLHGCAVLAPDASGEFGAIDEYFARLAAAGIRAIRLFPNIHFYTLKPYVLQGVLEQAALWHMPVLIDCVDLGRLGHVYSTWDYMPDFDGVYELATAWPQINFILLLPGMTSQRQQYAILQACPNVLLETSGYSYRFIEQVCARFSAKRLVAGSYMPVVDPSAMMTGVLYANISEEEKQAIAGETMRQLLAKAGRKEEV